MKGACVDRSESCFGVSSLKDLDSLVVRQVSELRYGIDLIELAGHTAFESFP